MTNLKREIELLKELDHPNIIKLYHAVEDKRSVYILTYE
jgi:serine/threonine protein kinase